MSATDSLLTICQAYNIPGIHPAAELFPLIEGKEFDELCHSIGTHGLEQDIILTHDGYLLDGRNRLRACYRTGALERFKKLDAIYANDYVGYVVRLNLNRRHLNESQRAVIAARLANMTAGGDKRSEKYHSADLPNDQPSISQPQAAEMLNVSERLVRTVKAVERQAPELIEKIERGEITAGRAMEQVKQLPPKPEPRKTLWHTGSITLTQWNHDQMQDVPFVDSDKTFNPQAENSEESMANIEWARWSWNPVTGCKHDCPYCYARDIAQRFYPQGFEPTLHPDRLRAPYNTRVPRDADSDPAKRNVFANSMADLYGRWVPQVWIDAVFQSMADNPQWNFLTLTKFPKRAAELVYPKNVWIGTSVDLQARVKAAEEAFERIECGVRWLSLEPLIEPLTFSKPHLFDWVVIGGASRSSQTPEWVPPAEWVIRTASQFLNHGARIYLKTNGRPRQMPHVIVPETADDVFHYLSQ